MAVSGKYGKIEIKGVGADEPVFILRAQDRLAQPAIEMYCALAGSHGSPVTQTLQKEIDQFCNWKGIKKMPD